jgi:hypothetical protein
VPFLNHSTKRRIAAILVAAFASSLTVEAAASDTVNDSPHRVFAEVGGFSTWKFDERGGALGLGYGYRPVRGLEIGAGLRYYFVPESDTDVYVAAPIGSTAPSERVVDPGSHMWTMDGYLRPFIPFDSADRFELGLGLRVGLLLANATALANVSAAPDLRVRITRSSALQLSLEFMIGQTGQQSQLNEDHPADTLFGQTGVWVTWVQTL